MILKKYLKKIIENFPAPSSIVVILEAKNRGERDKARITVKRAVDTLVNELSDIDKLDVEALKNELLRLKDNLMEMSDLAYSTAMNKILFALNDITGLNMESKQVGESVIDELVSEIFQKTNGEENFKHDEYGKDRAFHDTQKNQRCLYIER